MMKIELPGNEVLTIGIECQPPKGGIGQVEWVYSSMFRPFKHIASAPNEGGACKKIVTLAKAMFRMAVMMAYDHEIRIVHIHTASNGSFWRKCVFIAMAKMCGRRVVLHVHGGGFAKFEARHHKLVARFVERADAVIVLSEYWKEYFASHFSVCRLVIIKNVIEQPQPKRNKQNCFTLLFLGKICDAKGIFDLLALLAEYQHEYRGRLQLLFGGNGETERAERFVEEHGIADIACFEGWVSGEKKDELFNKADALILPSYIEGLPICILEAMSYGLPVISTLVGGIPEILHDGVNGYLVEPGDKAGIKKAIDALIAIPEQTGTMGQKSLDMVKEHLPQRVSLQLQDVYSSLN